MGQKVTEKLIPIIKVGDPAPAWAAQAVPGRISGSDYLGKGAILLFFYPADWSEVVQEELPLLEELVTLAGNVRLKTFGISSDNLSSHKAFTRELGLQLITLLSDPQHQVSGAFGVIDGQNGLCKQAAFLIDENNRVRWVHISSSENDYDRVAEIEKALEMVREWNGLSGSLETWKQERQQALQLPRAVPLAPPTCLTLNFWGTRGSIPVSGVCYNQYGGNTSCLSLTSDTGHLFILDCGSGLRQLGDYLLSPAWQPVQTSPDTTRRNINGYILLSHTHWDHIQGFPFFSPVFQPENQFNIIGWSNCSQTLASILAGQMEYKYFPVSMDKLPSHLSFYSIRHGEAVLDGVKIRGCLLKHPTPSTAYRMEIGGKVIIYATDHEPNELPQPDSETLLGLNVINPVLLELAQGADLLIHDAQYSGAELLDHVGWGHSSIEVAVDTAIRSGVKRLILFHHDPSHDDPAIDALLASARRRAAFFNKEDLIIEAGFDGMSIEFTLK